MRHLATMSLFERRDVIIVASVSCIYGLGSPEAYHNMLILLEEGMEMSREEMLRRLIEIQYQRKEYDFHRGTFRVRGDVVEIYPGLRGSEGPPRGIFRRRGRLHQRDRPPHRQDSGSARPRFPSTPAATT